MSEKLSNLVIRECRADKFADCDLVFSGLNSDIAGETGKPIFPRSQYLWPPTDQLHRDGVHQG